MRGGKREGYAGQKMALVAWRTGTWRLQIVKQDEKRRPGTKRGMVCWTADRAIDRVRDRFGWEAVGYGSVALGLSRSVPDEFRELAEKDL